MIPIRPNLALVFSTTHKGVLCNDRAWQLFDWVRALTEDNGLQKLCDSNTYTTMISLCGPWQQVRRALSLVADMRARSLECGIQASPPVVSVTYAFCAKSLKTWRTRDNAGVMADSCQSPVNDPGQVKEVLPLT